MNPVPLTPNPDFGSTLVSAFDHVFDVSDPGQRPLADILNAIRAGAVAEQVAVIRAVQTDTASTHEIQAVLITQLDHVESITKRPAQRTELATARTAYFADPHSPAAREAIVGWLKKGLPGVLFAGQFTRRGAKWLTVPSGAIVIDLDDLPNPAATVAEISADPHCVAAFVSPTRTGAKIVMRVPPADANGHRDQTFPAVAAYLKTRYGVIADPSGCDVSRLCYISHDPAMTINLVAAPLAIPEVAIATEPQAGAPVPMGTVSREYVEELLHWVPPSPPYDKWLRVSSAVWSAVGETVGTDLLQAWSPDEHYDDKYPNRLQEIGIGTLRFYAAEAGWKPSTDNLAFDGYSYWRREAGGNFGRLSREDVSLEMRRRGASSKKAVGCEISQLDESLHHIQTNARVDYAAPFCGRNSGLYVENGIRVLATCSPRIIEASPGDASALITFVEVLLGRDADDPSWILQRDTFYAWLQRARRALHNWEQHLPGQLLALVGPADCGKTLMQTLVTMMLGGRQADPSLWLCGKSTFNDGIWGAEHWAASDSNIEDTLAARKMLRDRVKEATANESLGCHRKHRGEITLRPIARLTLSANDDANSTFVLPTLDDSIRDKVIYMKCHRPTVPFPTETEAGAKAFFKSLTEAVPAFLHLVEAFEVPAGLRKGRFGVREFHHESLVDLLVGANADADLGDLITAGLELNPEGYFGTAVAIYDQLKQLHPETLPGVCGSSVKLGQALGRLSRADGWRGRVTWQDVRNGPNRQKQRIWTIRGDAPGGQVADMSVL